MTAEHTQAAMLSLADLTARADALRIIPLGGLGEIGMNCCLLQAGPEVLMVDCGQMMPEEEMLGVDYVIPDTSFLEEQPDILKAIVLTHAHEDHVGALPFVLPKFPKVPVYASDLTIALLTEKLREYNLAPDFREIRPRETVRIGDGFEVEPISVTHSMIDAMALAIRTPIGTVIHTGDFKMDPNPPDGVPFDYYAFTRHAEESEDGVLALMSDSTNVDRTGSCPSETEVIPGLETIFRQSRSALIVATFASSLHRIQNVLNLAAKYDRAVVAAGLNMERNIRIASEIGAIDIPCEYYSDSRAAKRIDPQRRLVLCTGSQGEPMSGLARMAHDSHRDVKIEEGDTVVLSARIIPGNEGAIYRLINHLCRRGAHVIHEAMAPIHVSGHGYRDDMKHMINLTNPQYFIPVHGEFRHLREHCELARQQGMQEDEVFQLEDGDCLELTRASATLLGKVPHGRVLVDGKGIGDIDEVILRDRMYLSQDGMVLVILGIDHETGELLTGPEIVMRGFAFGEQEEESQERLKRTVLEVLDEMDSESRTDQTVLQADVKRALRRLIRKEFFRFPVILPVILEL